VDGREREREKERERERENSFSKNGNNLTSLAGGVMATPEDNG
jgi:hypothetical protein